VLSGFAAAAVYGLIKAASPPPEVSTTADRILALLRSANLPLPQTNRPASGRYVDCRWPEHNLTVELDSYTYHHTRHAWEQDRRRARQAHARGDDFRRYTRDDVKKDSQQVLVELRGLLSGAPGSGSRSGSPRPTPSAGSRAPGSRPRP
jgi:very-short-patch-repair endonuclease